MKNKELFDRANADGDKELQAKLRNDFAETNCKHMTNERTCGLKSNAYRHRCYGEDKCRHCASYG